MGNRVKSASFHSQMNALKQSLLGLWKIATAPGTILLADRAKERCDES